MRRLKFHVLLVVACTLFAPVTILTSSALAQDAADASYVPLAPEDLQPLVAPVALYPDALLAQIFVACTYPDDIAAAVQYVDGGGDPNAIDNQGWDLSVAGVARYPDLLHYMASNGDWMNSLGSAFLNQQADVMNEVQALRGEAVAAGNLVSNDQQQVVTDDDGTIEIIPTDPQTIYPPIYDPAVVYHPEVVVVGQPYVPLIHYWNGIHVGEWLHHDLDWHDHSLYVGAWGADRPWWHHDNSRGGRFDYTHDRPGLYANNNTNIRVNVHNQIANVRGGQWTRQTHDPKKAMPKFVARPANHVAAVRPGSGYVPRNVPAEHPGGAITNYNHASTVTQQSNRGRTSVQKSNGPTHTAPPPPVSQNNRHAIPPAHSTPVETPHVNPAPARAPVRTSPTVRGGAVNNYNNGAAASKSSDRGAASRGGASHSTRR